MFSKKNKKLIQFIQHFDGINFKKENKSYSVIKSIQCDLFHYAKYFIEDFSINVDIFEGNRPLVNILIISVEKGCDWLSKYLIEEKKMNIFVANRMNGPNSNLLIDYLTHNNNDKESFNQSFFEYLIQKGLDINCCHFSYYNLLLLAYHDLHIVKLLIKNGLDIHSNVSKVSISSKCGISIETTNYLLNHFPSLNFQVEKAYKDFHPLILFLSPIRNLKININYLFGTPLKTLIRMIDRGIPMRNILLRGNVFINALDLLHSYNVLGLKEIYYLLKTKIIMKGLEFWHSPHTHITLPFTKENICDWKLLFISTLNHSPLVFQSNK